MSKLKALNDRLADVNALHAAGAILDWDHQTYMPKGGIEARAAHVSILTRMAHEQFTSDEVGKLIDEAASEVGPDSDDQAMLRVVKRDFDLQTKIPTSLVEEKSRLSSIAHEHWVEARQSNNFAGFAPTLERMFEIARLEAEALGYKEHIYDALLDQYEEGATQQDACAMFEAIKGPQVKLLKDIVESGNKPDDSKLYGDWDVSKQSAFTEMMVQAIGFDFDRGRQDTAHHPFCTNFSIGDVRLTTRYKPYLGSAIFGSLHEAGHGMYEQGSPMAWDRTPLAGGASLGLHESQSRTWENIVGRSRSFWSHFLPKLQETFPELSSFDLDTFYKAINKVEPTLIRVEADECTYNLHILVRFELECDLLTGTLRVQDLPEAWNQKYSDYLGITPTGDGDGCLQDVHWSAALIGYFPTYSMGNLLSYQIWNSLLTDISNVDEMMAKGDFKPILTWLRQKLYSKGRKFTPKSLVQEITGKSIGAEDYLAGLDAKYRAIYGI